MDVYNSIMLGLEEALEDAKGEKKLPRHTVWIEPVKEYSASQVKEIRGKTGMSQKNFAGYLGVSPKTVEAWEAGRNCPCGASSRLLSIIEMYPAIIKKCEFVKLGK